MALSLLTNISQHPTIALTCLIMTIATRTSDQAQAQERPKYVTIGGVVRWVAFSRSVECVKSVTMHIFQSTITQPITNCSSFSAYQTRHMLSMQKREVRLLQPLVLIPFIDTVTCYYQNLVNIDPPKYRGPGKIVMGPEMKLFRMPLFRSYQVCFLSTCCFYP